MKAALYEKPHYVNVVSKELRALKSGELLVKVEACGVCGTDVHIVEGNARSMPPVVLGHEYGGVVEDMAPEVDNFSLGQRIAIDPNISCGICYWCRRGEVHLCANLKALGVDIDGGMAQFCIVPQRQAYALPETFPHDCLPFIEPLSCVIHGVDRARVKSGDTVAIIGAGTIGLLMLQMIKHAGAARAIIIEPNEQKQNIAQALGADVVLNPENNDIEKATRESTGVGADVVIECAGIIQTAQMAIDMARRGGTVEFFGVCPIGKKIEVEPNQVYFKELTIVGSYVNPMTFTRAIDILHNTIVRVELFQVQRFPLERVREALEFQREGKTIKSVITPNA